MKKQKILCVLILVLFAVVVSFGQNVVKDTSNVKKPSEGKLYYQKKDKSLYLYREGKFEIDNKFNEVVIISPPNEVIFKKVADWDDKITGLHMDIETWRLDGKFYLLRNYKNGDEYAISGINILKDNVKISNLNLGNIKIDTSVPETNLNGLFPYKNFPTESFLKLNTNYFFKDGVFYKNKIQGNEYKFKLDVILSYWNGFTRDYVNCPPGVGSCNPNGYNPLVNEPSRNRFGLSLYNQKPPFWGSYHEPRTITMTDYRDGQNVSVTGTATVDFNYTQASLDKDLEYAAGAGVKAFNFFLYADNTVISEHSRFYLTSKSPFKEKVQYAYTLNNLDRGMVLKIAKEMTTKYYYKYNNRPVVWINDVRGTQFSSERYILQSGAHWVVEPTESYWKENEGYTGPVRLEPATGYVRCNGEVKRTVFVDLLKSLVPNVFLIHDHTWFYDYDRPSGFDALGAYTAPISGPNRPYTQAEHIAAHKSELENRLNAGNTVIPTITLGFQNMFQFKPAAPSIAEATVGDIENHFKMIAELSEKYGDKIPFINVYSYSEMLECGQWALVPRLNNDGTIDDSKLKILANILK